jgi:hypothetical protein
VKNPGRSDHSAPPIRVDPRHRIIIVKTPQGASKTDLECRRITEGARDNALHLTRSIDFQKDIFAVVPRPQQSIRSHNDVFKVSVVPP